MAELVAARLVQFAPVTNHYRLTAGQYILVTKPDDIQPVPEGLIPVVAGIRVDHVIPPPCEVFLCDETAQVIDADGDPTNGLTPLLRLDPDTSFEAACTAAEEALADA